MNSYNIDTNPTISTPFPYVFDYRMRWSQCDHALSIGLNWNTSVFNIQKDRDISTSFFPSAAVRTRNLSVDEGFCEMQQMLFGIKARQNAPDDREKNELC